MDVLVIGGNRFVGYLVVWRLLARGDRVTVFNRGTRPDPFGDRVERVRGDRNRSDFPRLLEGRRFDATVDFAAYKSQDVGAVIEGMGERAGHYVFISTGQVYLVRQDCPTPSREADYDGPLLPRPHDPAELPEWEYGVNKRACEDLLAEASGRLPSTRLRIPMVNGERDHYRRIETYLWRILDGGPVLLPDGGSEVTRHVYGLDVAAAIVTLLHDERTYGQAFNLCQQEIATVFDLLGMLIERAGAPDNRVEVPRDRLDGLPAKEISPFSHRWMSLLDPSLAQRELGFRHRPLGVYLSSIVASFLSHPSLEPPPNYVHRPAELELARRLGS
jgi:nucleoside-diphosphate-sugar epimerase